MRLPSASNFMWNKAYRKNPKEYAKNSNNLSSLSLWKEPEPILCKKIHCTKNQKQLGSNSDICFRISWIGLNNILENCFKIVRSYATIYFVVWWSILSGVKRSVPSITASNSVYLVFFSRETLMSPPNFQCRLLYISPQVFRQSQWKACGFYRNHWKRTYHWSFETCIFLVMQTVF